MRKVIAVVALAVVLGLTAKAQAPVTTEDWTLHASSGCVPSVRYPEYFCFAYGADTDDNDASTLTMDVVVGTDGSFSNGHISMSGLYGNPPSFTAVNWTGSNFSGSFSGTKPDGTPFHGSATVVMGTIRRCARNNCQYIFGPVSGSVTATFGQ